MLYLLVSIILASYIILSFKVAERLHIDKFRVISSAVVACIVCKEKLPSSNRKDIGLSLIAIVLIAFT